MSDTEEQPTKKLKLNKDELAGLPAGAKPLSHQVAGHASTGGTQSQKKGNELFCSHYCLRAIVSGLDFDESTKITAFIW